MPTPATLVHIVPTVPPAFNGLSDYCFKLWQHWPAPRPDWHCLAADVPAGAGAAWPQARIESFECSKRGLLEALQSSRADCAVLHYVGYAYQKRGIPLWLPGALRAWKARGDGGRRGGRKRVCVMFHELYATGGSPRGSAFWLQPWARSIVAQLEQLADAWVVSNEETASRLIHGLGADARRGQLIPVGAAIEPVAPTDFARAWPLTTGRKMRVAVFGLPASRFKALDAHKNWLKLACERDWIESVALIGKAESAAENAASRALRAFVAPSDLALWRSHADLAPAQVSQLLANCDVALSRNLPVHLSKSTIYAAACLHDLVTLCPPASRAWAPSRLRGSSLDIPRVCNDDARPQNALANLRDADFIGDLRTRIERIAGAELNWANIANQWSEVVALTPSFPDDEGNLGSQS